MELSISIAAVVVSLTVLVSLKRYYQSKERQAMIEKGLDPSLVNIYSNKSNRKVFLFGGVLLLGVALGIITGIILATIFDARGETKEMILLSTLIFTGLSLFVCYYLSEDKKS